MRDESKELPPEVTEDGEHEEISERYPDVKDQQPFGAHQHRKESEELHAATSAGR
jgi:hypothetical protein